MKNWIFGEESNKFSVASETKSETIEIKISDSKDDLNRILNSILFGNSNAISLIADAIFDHQPSAVELSPEEFPESIGVDENSVGIWIDPIDGTNVFISPQENTSVSL